MTEEVLVVVTDRGRTEDKDLASTVYVLEPDLTWRACRGPRFTFHYVRFTGTREAIAKRAQELRESCPAKPYYHPESKADSWLTVNETNDSLVTREGVCSLVLRFYVETCADLPRQDRKSVEEVVLELTEENLLRQTVPAEKPTP
jgi:hypothetical protein